MLVVMPCCPRAVTVAMPLSYPAGGAIITLRDSPGACVRDYSHQDTLCRQKRFHCAVTAGQHCSVNPSIRMLGRCWLWMMMVEAVGQLSEK